jgi:hypothetical protein
MKHKVLFSLIVVLLTAALVTPVFAGHIVGSATNQETCEFHGGVWSGPDSINGTCTIPPGALWYTHFPDDAPCAPTQWAVQTVEEIYITSVTCLDSLTASRPSPFPRCGPVDRPRLISPSAATPISFKGSANILSAALSLPGHDSLPISGLVFDPDTNTWSGFVNTLYLPAGLYSPARVMASNDFGDKVCHFGSLTIQ